MPRPTRGLIAADVVVDASIAVQWFANEPGAARAAQLLGSEIPLVAPDIMPVEAANAWWKKVKRAEMRPDDLDQAIVNLLGLEIIWIPTTMLLPPAARLAVELGHPVYDCVYLLLARGRRAALATADRPLQSAARRTGVTLWEP